MIGSQAPSMWRGKTLPQKPVPLPPPLKPTAIPKSHDVVVAGVTVQFPHPAMYPAQSILSEKLIEAMDKSLTQRSCALLESPTGTGKTLALLTSSLAWQAKLAQFGGTMHLPPALQANEVEAGFFPPVAPPSVDAPEQSSVSTDAAPLPSQYEDLLADYDDWEDMPSVTNSASQIVAAERSPTSSLPLAEEEMDDSLIAQVIQVEEEYKRTVRKKRHLSVDEEELPVPKRPPAMDSSQMLVDDLTGEEMDELMQQVLEETEADYAQERVAEGSAIKVEVPLPEKHIPVIIYATRTHSQVKKAIAELGKTSYRPRISVLGSRDQYCINHEVRIMSDKLLRDLACKSLVRRNACTHYRARDAMLRAPEIAHGPLQVWDIEDLVELSHTYHGCPYYVSRELAKAAQLVFCVYNYLVDLSVVNTLPILKDSICIIDEAHNIENTSRDEASLLVKEEHILNHNINLTTVFAEAKYYARQRDLIQKQKLKETEMVKTRLRNAFSASNPQNEISSAPVVDSTSITDDNKEGILQSSDSQSITLPISDVPSIGSNTAVSPFSLSRHASSASSTSSDASNRTKPLSASVLRRNNAQRGAYVNNVMNTLPQGRRARALHPDSDEEFEVDGDDGDQLPELEEEDLPPPDFFQVVEFLTPLKAVFESMQHWMLEIAPDQLIEVPHSRGEHFSRSWKEKELVEVLRTCKVTETNIGHLSDCLEKASITYETLEMRWQKVPAMTWSHMERSLRIFHFILENDFQYLNDYRFIVTKKRDVSHHFVIELNMLCLNPAILFRELLASARSVSLVSGTLTPFSSMRAELGIEPIVKSQNIFQVITPHIIERGSPQLTVLRLKNLPNGDLMRWDYASRNVLEKLDQLGLLMLKLVEVIPDGVLAFFSGYTTMHKFVERWKAVGLFERLSRVKQVVLEPQTGKKEFEEAWTLHQASVDDKRGSLFLGVCRGKIAEGMDFEDEYARAVLIIGVPYAAVKEEAIVQKRSWNSAAYQRQMAERSERERALKANNQPELNVLRQPSLLSFAPAHLINTPLFKNNAFVQANPLEADARGETTFLQGDAWYALEAARATNQAVGRCIRHRFDYGAIIFLDDRYCDPKTADYMSRWVRQACSDPITDVNKAISQLRLFYDENKVLNRPKANKRTTSAPPALPTNDANVSPFASAAQPRHNSSFAPPLAARPSSLSSRLPSTSQDPGRLTLHAASRKPSPDRKPQSQPIPPLQLIELDEEEEEKKPLVAATPSLTQEGASPFSQAKTRGSFSTERRR